MPFVSVSQRTYMLLLCAREAYIFMSTSAQAGIRALSCRPSRGRPLTIGWRRPGCWLPELSFEGWFLDTRMLGPVGGWAPMVCMIAESFPGEAGTDLVTALGCVALLLICHGWIGHMIA